MSASLAVGNRVTGTVIRCQPFGLLVRLDDGTPAIVRERELAWTAEELKGWRQKYAPGTGITAVVLERREAATPELSIRLVQFDPWTDLGDKLSVGQLVEGTVTVVQPYGVFVELAPGVTGLLHASRLPAWNTEPITDVFWPGDSVKAIVEHIDVSQRHIALSMTDIRTARWPADERGNGAQRLYSAAGAQAGATSTNAGQSARPARLLAELPQAHAILLVENDAGQRDTWVKWLRSIGQHAVGVASAEEALSRIANQPFDLVFMDVHLPGMSGTEALRRILDQIPHIRGVLMTGDWAYLQHPDAERLITDGVEVLIKPLQPEDVYCVLSTAAQAGAAQGAALDSRRPSPRAGEGFDSKPSRARASGPQRLLEQSLLRAQRLTKAETAVLFKLDVSSRRVQIELPRDNRLLATRAETNLIHSPVRDVAEDREFCVIEDIEAAPGKVRYLLPLLNFRACIGVPVPIESSHHYALFFFYSRPTAFDDVRREQARAGALAVGAALERCELADRIIARQRDILFGQLNRGLVHELNQRLPPAADSLNLLVRQLATIQRTPQTSPDAVREDGVRQAQEMAAKAVENITKLSQVSELFKKLTLQGSIGTVRVDRVAEETIALVRDLAHEAGVSVTMAPPDHILLARTNELHLQHALLNLIVNAVQQIALLRPNNDGQGHKGRVHIYFTEHQHRSGPIVQVHIEDDGPGIHRQHTQAIFDLGFTTRREGSGLGLYVARLLMEGMHGQVYLGESVRLWGTRFVLKLPAGV